MAIQRFQFSISTRLFLNFFGLLVAALVILGALGSYWFTLRESERLNSFLDSEAKIISNRLEGIVEGLGEARTKPAADLTQTLHKDLDHFLDQRLDRPLPYKTTLLILDANNRVLGESNRALDLYSDISAVSPGKTDITDVTGRGPSFRVLTSRFDLGSGQFGTFRIACLLENLTLALWNFVASLVIVLGGSLILLTALGVWIIRRTLLPVRSMAAAAGKISEQNLSSRIPVPPGKDELAKLAQTLNRLLARLETDYAFQERLVGELTHELKTPLTILRGRNEQSLTTRETVEAYRELVYENLEELDGLGTLLNSILELARIDSRIDKLTKVPVDLGDFLRKLTHELDPLWMAKDLKTRLEGLPAVFEADPRGLKQIFMNMLNNAWKYAPVGSTIDFRWEFRADQVVVTLTNQGPPIPDDDLELIFKRFFRSSRRDPDHQGSGLGLSIVRSLVSLHGGNVRAFNPPGGGAAFEIEFPR